MFLVFIAIHFDLYYDVYKIPLISFFVFYLYHLIFLRYKLLIKVFIFKL